MSIPEKTVQRVEVVLTGPHTHEGKPYEKGGKIMVTARQKAFLEEAKKVDAKAERVPVEG